MDTLEYNGYIAKIDYDPDIDSFIGHVINLSSPVTFYGKNMEELKKEFIQSINEWKLVCSEQNIEWEEPESQRKEKQDHMPIFRMSPH